MFNSIQYFVPEASYKRRRQKTHVQLLVLHCEATWGKPGHSWGYIDLFQNLPQTHTQYMEASHCLKKKYKKNTLKDMY